MTRITTITATLLVALGLGGCAGVVYQAPSGSNTPSGKCQGPDYNAPSCIYVF